MTSKRMTRAEMIQWLGNVIRTETEKPFDEIDYEFVNECGNLLDELMGKSIVLSETEIEERLVKLKADISASSASVKTKTQESLEDCCCSGGCSVHGCYGVCYTGFA